VIATRGDPLQTVFPPIPNGVRESYLKTRGSVQYQKAFGENTFKKHVHIYGHNSTRKIFRELMRSPGRTALKNELIAIAGRRTEDCLEFYGAMQVFTEEDDTIRLNVTHDNLGPSLEQYVAMLCMAKLKGHAEWGVTLEGVENGDVDVIAWLPPKIVYVECKIGAPGTIGASSFHQMSLRIRDLSPDLAVLLIDSEDDLAPLCKNAYESNARWRLHLQPRFKGIYYGVFQHWPIYVINADPSILAQIRLCLRHFYSQGQWMEAPWGSIWAENP
jgi:hypothetical protein